ncbi:superoxide-generating NADPH oxidase heavy chain subunit C-like [Macrobrachium nipponense]|uniref:superoxide-generating NADPH oxidase heavy chain subunit C-like n=1 Tax=Macrobrachium nipponense TaxID=159736 RepID=UPI0030C89FA7
MRSKLYCVIFTTYVQFSFSEFVFDRDVTKAVRKELRRSSKLFLERNQILLTEPFESERFVDKNGFPSSNGIQSQKEPPNPVQLTDNATKRPKRSACPGGVGNFGFNSFNLLTFALQVFNGVINTINNVNNNNNNNNINAANSANSNFNQQTSNTNSMSMLVVVVPPGRKRRDEWNNESGGCASQGNDEEVRRVVEDTYSTLAEIMKLSDTDMASCGQYVLCLNVQNSLARYGFQALSTMAGRESLWESIVEPMITNQDCSELYPECNENYNKK